MRTLRPDRLFDLPSGLWAVDAEAPVAAILAPGAEPRLVSWPELPPSRTLRPWPPSRVLDDGECLWAQSESGGSAARIGPDGIPAYVWTDGLWLAATGPGVAWFSTQPPEQEIVYGSAAGVAPHTGVDRLLRIDRDGHREELWVESSVHHVQPGADALCVCVESGGHTVVDLGCDSYEVDRATVWLALPWDAPVPEQLTIAEHAAPLAPERRWDDGGRLDSPWHDEDATPVVVHGLSWRAGWDCGSPPWARTALVTAHAADGTPVGRWALGTGRVSALVACGDGVALAVARPRGSAPDAGPIEVLTLDPADRRPRTVLAQQLDISAQVPLVRPIDADSYLAAMLARYPVPDLSGIADAHSRLIGQWPETRMEWTFTHPSRPGLVLRRRLALFDGLGRLAEPEYCDVHLMEDLDTGALPPADRARGGILEI